MLLMAINVMTYIHIFQEPKKKVLFDFLDIMCVKECIVYRICLLVIGSRGQRQERPDYSNLKIV